MVKDPMKGLFESRLAKTLFVIKESNSKAKHLKKSGEAKLNFMKIYGMIAYVVI